MAEQDQARARPELEMAKPELLVDQADASRRSRRASRRDPDVGEREELQDLVLGAPDRREARIASSFRKRSDDLVFAVALIGPAASLEILSSMSIGAPSSRSS